MAVKRITDYPNEPSPGVGDKLLIDKSGGTVRSVDWNTLVFAAVGPPGSPGTNGTNGVGVPLGGGMGQVLTKNTAANYDTVWATVAAGGGVGSNRLINPDGRVWQRENSGAASVTDATYAFDRWYGLTQTAGVTASQVVDVENGTPAMMRLSQANASAQRFGIAQVIEGVNCKDMRGKAAALSARVRMSAATTLRYAILEWTGTVDAVGSAKDVVADWTNGTFTAGNFFNSTTLTVTATGSIALAANTPTDVSLLTTLGSAVNNVIVLFWTNTTQAQNVTLDIGRAKLEQGAAATAYEPRTYATELVLCQRYFEAISSANGAAAGYGLAQCASTSRAILSLAFKTTKRAVPTVSFSAISDWAFYNSTASAYVVWSSFGPSMSEFGGVFDVTTATAGLLGPGYASIATANAATTAARMFFSAEL